MCVVIGLVVLAVSLPLGDCPHHYQSAYAKLSPPLLHPPLRVDPTRSSSMETPPIVAMKRQGIRSRRSTNAKPIAPVVHSRASAMPKVALDKVEHCAIDHSKPGGHSAGNALSEESRGECNDLGGMERLSPIIDTVGGIASALTVGKTDQAVRTAKTYLESLKFNAVKYYWSLAADRAPSDQSEAAANLIPGPSLFDEPERGIDSLKILRQGIEKELAIDETDARNNKFADAETRRKVTQRVVNAQRLIDAIGTDADLDHALAYLAALHSEPQWSDFMNSLTGAVEDAAKIKFEAIQARAKKLGGVQQLTSEDIEGLSFEQIKELRGY